MYKDTLYPIPIPGKEPHTGVMVTCPQTFTQTFRYCSPFTFSFHKHIKMDTHVYKHMFMNTHTQLVHSFSCAVPLFQT